MRYYIGKASPLMRYYIGKASPLMRYYIGKASPLMRCTNMAELSDSIKQLDTVGRLRYKEKLGVLGVTTDTYSTPRDIWPTH